MKDKNKIQCELEDNLREEYDLTELKNPVRGKYYQQYQKGHSVTIHYEDGTRKTEYFPPENNSDIIILDPDVKKYFPDSESVNSTLRSLIKLIPQ
ncbi:hypothetical protein VKI21_16820 [Cyanobacterium aponinum UTEX 3222]|uniref:Uncharacterized protein n=2 Tax=Cyanobacterium aponinum TaxID=379064 RepID=K9Z4V4_CYAAP|nr:hypothetical protein [Cyanobacterium aponinum]WRL41686.1 hypothetical protein VKI21_16820 [Cyanobacterium aponinum UTEX 3222]AFZ53443.1 hypothetical protein Cyan10605_1328 [Cyanobacterium aponinum PCC 10605]PHV61757.1 hypothetical protein CSQ80_13870 [Cyanobacterium aponinum IPPAS B-1201]WPF89875.1 hypothetical protein SAY89_06300 [Cyanobacterium aponinum AL20115]WRL37834.1 hypothetical protein VKI22_14585 [Cyanobacterium aponinum UTEX 3221]